MKIHDFEVTFIEECRGDGTSTFLPVIKLYSPKKFLGLIRVYTNFRVEGEIGEARLFKKESTYQRYPDLDYAKWRTEDAIEEYVKNKKRNLIIKQKIHL